ncbi:MAG: tetratricopeptide repeat protein [Candidatus Omnitrophica bacterium]|nr:tetratricopeptide repeat protein [Candidatus Omnitrophota bacterium]
MKQEQKKYILENINRKSPARIAKELNIPERKIKRLLACSNYKDNKKISLDTSPKISQNKKVLFISIALIIILGCIAYASSLSGKFVWDDELLIKNNVFIRNLPGIEIFFKTKIFAEGCEATYFYRPLQIVTYALDYAIWKFNVVGYHITNTLLHILVALCIYWLVNILYKDNKLSFLASALFVVHPIHTEAVSYISGRADSLSVFFMLLCFIIYIKQVDRDSISIPSYILLLFTYTLALLSKEMSMILPLLLLFYHFVFRKKIKVVEFLSLLGILAIYTAIRLTYLKSISLSPQFDSDTMFGRLPGFFVAILSYIRLLFLPFSLHMDYGTKLFGFTDPSVLIGIIITITILTFAYLKRNNKVILFSIGLFFLALFPVSNLYKINAYMSEHFLYLPSIGFFILIAYLLIILYNDKRHKALGLTLTIVYLLFYTALTIKQNYYWKEPLAFYDRTIKLAPDSTKAYNNRGILYENKGNHDQAISDWNKAIQITPDYAQAYNNRGSVNAGKGNDDQAIADFDKVIQIKPDYAQAYNNRGNAYRSKDNYDQAISDYNKAIQIKPDYAEAYNGLGIAHKEKGNYDQAISDYNKAIQLKPDYAEAYNNRGNVYSSKRDYHQAVLDFTKAIQLTPDFAMAYGNRAIAYYYKNEFDKAWNDVHKMESLNYKVKSQLLELLKKSSGREK